MPLPLVLISTPIDLGKIKLGNLVPNVSQPHIDAFEPSTLPEDAVHVSEQLDFKTRIEKNHGTTLEASLTKLLSGSRSNTQTHMLNLSAFKAKCYEMKSPLAFFKEIISQERTRMRLQDAIDDGHKMYIITALRTVMNAQIAQSILTSKDISAGAGIPLGAILAGGIDPTGGLVDIQGNLSRGNSAQQTQIYLSPTEQVYAVGYRRIGFKWFVSKNVDTAFLDVKNRWKVMGEEIMGDEDEDVEDIVEADLEESLEGDDIIRFCKDRHSRGRSTFYKPGLDRWTHLVIEPAMGQRLHVLNISASAGEDESIRYIILVAEAQGLIAFAAASAQETKRSRVFPARIEKVMAVQSAGD
ncbi:hypothetical protein F25303_1826 [Fusarium sp. NRRL 25303]|nr:hypothetical protein F25303_1826 [Fusarium sp. NRRL 25303]